MPNNQVEMDKVLIEGRKKLSMTGVDSVDGFSEQTLNLTVSGGKVKISGENIKITAYNKATGALNADGVFNEIKYNAKKIPFVKRLFK
ncbi:MAG: YabP/YqfC family sporulation protein [Clostridia bacterium]|nr:YabP/YqfC family sporulation protein [Clostridia bacterium]